MTRGQLDHERVAAIPRQAAKGELTTPAICRQQGITENTFYRWHKIYDRMTILGTRRRSLIVGIVNSAEDGLVLRSGPSSITLTIGGSKMFEMTFTNFSSQEFVLGYTQYSYTGSIGAGVQTSPSSPLNANDGSQTSSVYLSLGDTHGYLDLICSWISDSLNLRFGVWLHFPAQVLGIGTAPYWKVMSDNVTDPNADIPESEWQSNGSNSSDSYNWPLTSLSISAVPTVTNGSLNVAVTIQNPPSVAATK